VRWTRSILSFRLAIHATSTSDDALPGQIILVPTTFKRLSSLAAPPQQLSTHTLYTTTLSLHTLYKNGSFLSRTLYDWRTLASHSLHQRSTLTHVTLEKHTKDMTHHTVANNVDGELRFWTLLTVRGWPCLTWMMSVRHKNFFARLGWMSRRMCYRFETVSWFGVFKRWSLFFSFLLLAKHLSFLVFAWER